MKQFNKKYIVTKYQKFQRVLLKNLNSIINTFSLNTISIFSTH